MDFSEGLRVIGIKPDEKLALFADNSCRWLVADQGVHIFISNIVVWMIKVFLLLFFFITYVIQCDVYYFVSSILKCPVLHKYTYIHIYIDITC